MRVTVSFKTSASLPRTSSGVLRWMEVTKGNSFNQSFSQSKSSSGGESAGTSSASSLHSKPIATQEFMKKTKSQVLDLISPRQVVLSTPSRSRAEPTTATSNSNTVDTTTGLVEPHGGGGETNPTTPYRARTLGEPNLTTPVPPVVEKEIKSPLASSRLLQDRIHSTEMKQKHNPLALKSRGKGALLIDSRISSGSDSNFDNRGSNNNNNSSSSALAIATLPRNTTANHLNDSTNSYVDFYSPSIHDYQDGFV